MKKNNEFRAFSRLAGTVLSVSHSDIKAKMDAEKAAKKRKKLRVSSAPRAGDARD